MNRATAEEQLFRHVLVLLLSSPTDQGCRLDIWNLFQELRRQRCPFLGHRDADQLKDSLQNCSLLFEVEANSRNYSVFPKASLTLCPTHSTKSGSCPEKTCPDLHLCLFFLLSGECPRGKHCFFGHNLTTPHNQRLLQRHLLKNIGPTELRTLFRLPRSRQGLTVPKVCKFYNLPMGCRKGNECHCLHLCLDHVLENCESASCDKNHHVGHTQVTKMLTLYGVKVRGRQQGDILREVRFYHENLAGSNVHNEPVPRQGTAQGGRPRRSGSVPSLLRGREMSMASGSGQRAPSTGRTHTNSESSYSRLVNPGSADGKIEEICLYHLQGECRFKEKCRKLHCSEAFQWRLIPLEELNERDGVTSAWRGVTPESNVALERAFSQPQEVNCLITNAHDDEIRVELQTMRAENTRTRQQYGVRRISVPPPGSSKHRDFSTVWLWHWRNQDGVWSEFEFKNERTLISSDIVEQNYQIGIKTGISSPMKFDRFILDFAKMRLKDDTNRKFNVRRRPLLTLRSLETANGFDSDNSDDDREGVSDNDDSNDDNAVDDNNMDDLDDFQAGAVGTSYDVPESDKDDEARSSRVPAPAMSVSSILSPVHGTSKDYREVEKRFVMTLGRKSTVVAIHKVRNPQLQARYDMMKSEMKRQPRKKPHKKHRDEEMLYYGPSPNEDVAEIYTDGVDCDPPPASPTPNSTTLGQGGHFYTNASQANRKVGDQEERCMFVMKCLVGRHFGKAGSTQQDEQLCDCVVDDLDHPRVFVISNPSQTCPVYLITYRMR